MMRNSQPFDIWYGIIFRRKLVISIVLILLPITVV